MLTMVGCKSNVLKVSVVGFFIKLKSLKRVGLLDTIYKIQADYDLLYKIIIKKNVLYCQVNVVDIILDIVLDIVLYCGFYNTIFWIL